MVTPRLRRDWGVCHPRIHGVCVRGRSYTVKLTRRWLFTSPIRHWKNGEKDMAVKTWLISVVSTLATMIIGFKVAEHFNNKPAVNTEPYRIGRQMFYSDGTPIIG